MQVHFQICLDEKKKKKKKKKKKSNIMHKQIMP